MTMQQVTSTPVDKTLHELQTTIEALKACQLLMNYFEQTNLNSQTKAFIRSQLHSWHSLVFDVNSNFLSLKDKG